MAAVTLESPGCRTSPDILLDGFIGNEADDVFTFKVARGQARYFTRFEDVTGDGDLLPPTFMGNCLLYGQFRLSGWLIASQAIGLKNMVNKAKNPSNADGGGTVKMRFVYGGTYSTIQNVLVHEIILNYDAKAVNVGVRISGIMTDTDLTDLEQINAA